MRLWFRSNLYYSSIFNHSFNYRECISVSKEHYTKLICYIWSILISHKDMTCKEWNSSRDGLLHMRNLNSVVAPSHVRQSSDYKKFIWSYRISAIDNCGYVSTNVIFGIWVLIKQYSSLPIKPFFIIQFHILAVVCHVSHPYDISSTH